MDAKVPNISLDWFYGGRRPDDGEALALAATDDLGLLMPAAAALRDAGHGRLVSYSRKVFIPLTKLCRDVCHYCTFAHPPRKGERAFMTAEEILAVARAGAAAGCKEALFTLGDKPELRYRVAREELAELGHKTTLSYLREMALLVLEETGLMPHLNPGIMDESDILALREVSVSQGIMLESVSPRLMGKGACHHGSPDKDPDLRLATIEAAGRHAVPFTTGILIGIGETREERIEALLALRRLHDQYGHIQEIIVQNFRAKPDTRMADWPDAPHDELLWSIAVARLIFGAGMNIQAPPNLSPGDAASADLIAAGINDWGGVSPVTPDHVNPEAPWPHLDALARDTDAAGKQLVERLAVYPAYMAETGRWLDPMFQTAALQHSDAAGLARTDEWTPGVEAALPVLNVDGGTGRDLDRILLAADRGDDLGEADIVRLFAARGGELRAVTSAADQIRRRVVGDTVSYAVVRNINYTNVCYFKCQFCAFSKGKLSENLRGRPYDLSMEEIARRAAEAWDRGGSEVCMQGGIHPEYTGQTYLDILATVKAAAPGLHVHAFSPLEVYQGAQTLGIGLAEFLNRLKDAGLGSLPGTAAEILDDEVRATLCPDKINTSQWLEVMETAHGVGLRTTATIMFGHIDQPHNWARHLLRLRELQKKTGGFTELVPLPFVHMEAPIYLKGRARKGPTYRETLLMHAVGRLALNPHFENIQTSWVKMGADGAQACLNAGANDMGGTLMNESITRAAGSEHGQELPPAEMVALIRDFDRTPWQRTTLYQPAPEERQQRAFQAAPLDPIIETPARKYDREGPKRPLIRPGLEQAAAGDD
jgi:FO synthase